MTNLGVSASAQPDVYVDNGEVGIESGAPIVRQRVQIGGSSAVLLSEVSTTGHLLTSTAIEEVSGTITVAGTIGATPSTGLADADFPGGNGPTGAEHVTFAPTDDHESAHVQITGTWSGELISEASLDGERWFPTNLRRNAAGNEINNRPNKNGLWRGTMAGSRFYRVRSLPGFTGTAEIVLSGAKLSGTYLLSAVTTLSQQEYLGSSAGANRMWSVSSQDVTAPTQNTEYPCFMLSNTDASRVLVVYRMAVGASGQMKFRRYRSEALTRASGGTARTPRNMGTGLAAGSAASCWSGTTIVDSNRPTDYADQIFIGTAGGNSTVNFDGGLRIPPGQSTLWTMVPGANSVIGMVSAVFSDASTLT